MNIAVPRLDRMAGRDPERARPASLVADRAGKTTAYAISNLQERGEIFDRSRHRSLRGHDRRRERARRRPGRQHRRRRRSSPTCAPRRRTRRSAWCRRACSTWSRRSSSSRGRAGRGDAPEHPAAQAHARREPAHQVEEGRSLAELSSPSRKRRPSVERLTPSLAAAAARSPFASRIASAIASSSARSAARSRTSASGPERSSTSASDGPPRSPGSSRRCAGSITDP